MKKVYIADTPERAEEIISEIYASGYPQKMIVQEYIPGGDDHMRVLTSFSGADGHVRTMCLGHTMVEEHTPEGTGKSRGDRDGARFISPGCGEDTRHA